MTKEEIFNNNWKFTSGPPILGMSSIFQSMDEYAKQQAIAFVKYNCPDLILDDTLLNAGYAGFLIYQEQQNKPQ